MGNEEQVIEVGHYSHSRGKINGGPLDAIMIGRKRWGNLVEACVTFKTCGGTLKVAAALHRPPAPLGQSRLWKSCCMFWVNTQRRIRTHLPNNSSASMRHQQQCKHEPTNSSKAAQTAQWWTKESSRLSFGGAAVVPGGSSGGERSSSEVVVGGKDSWSQEISAVTPVLGPECSVSGHRGAWLAVVEAETQTDRWG